jgi:hypothetical protein
VKNTNKGVEVVFLSNTTSWLVMLKPVWREYFYRVKNARGFVGLVERELAGEEHEQGR